MQATASYSRLPYAVADWLQTIATLSWAWPSSTWRSTSVLALLGAGNRRKEQNVVRKSVGFNWGPGAVSTSYWTGVRLCDLLEHCGVRKPSQGARYVCFRGVQKELPQARPAELARHSLAG